MNILKLVKKHIIKILIGLLVLLATYSLEQFFFPLIFNKGLISLLGSISLVYYAFALSLANLILFILIAIKISRLSKQKSKTTYIGFSEVRPTELESIDTFHRICLEYLIQHDNYRTTRANLFKHFQDKTESMSRLDFSIILKEMQRLGYVTQENLPNGMNVCITDKACEKLATLK